MGGTTWDIQVRVVKGIIIFNLTVIMIGAILLKHWVPFVIGNIYGSITAIINFRLLAVATERSLMMLPRKANVYARNRSIIRLLIYGLTIYVSLVSEHINAVGTVIALLSIKPVILIQSFLYGA